MNNDAQSVFWDLLKAGLWDSQRPVSNYKAQAFRDVDWGEVYRIAEEQSVIGLIAEGIDRFKFQIPSFKIPQEWALQFIGQTLHLEQRNSAMNQFIAKLVSEMRNAGIFTLLVKGQGVAQCYERPLWRASGDVDLYLSKDNYDKAKSYLTPLAQHIDKEDKRKQHLGMNIDGWLVELHGTMRTEVSNRMNRLSNEVHQDIFNNGNVRSWDNNGVQVLLPSANNDVIIIFNHFINHFYGEGVGLRQICDWCRLLWTFRDSLENGLLERRILKAGLMTEWKAFAVFAAEYLEMPVEAMPLYPTGSKSHFSCYKKKAKKISTLIMTTGNFGHNKDVSYREKHSKMVVNFITLWVRLKEFARIATIFPKNALRFYVTYVINRFKAVA